VGAGEIAVAGVGTVAEIRDVTRYPDGRYDLVTLGRQRFRLEGVDPDAQPYLVGQITPLDEVLGEATRARALGDRVIQLFIRYLELLQVEEAAREPRPRGAVGSPGADAVAEEPPHPAESHGVAWALDSDALAEALDAGVLEEGVQPDVAAQASEPEAPIEPERTRAEILDEAARQLTIPDDPTILSYLLSGIVQVESIRRQGLLEMPTTELRLVELAHLLDREIALLERGLGSYVPDPRLSMLRRN
jgi:hypothetical protein